MYPAEEIVTAWLQECLGYFTMNNINVPKEKGGRAAEIDLLATNKKNNIWVEVSVSTNPRGLYKKEVRLKKYLNDFLKDFVREDKVKKVKKYFGKTYEKWFVYGKLAMNKEETLQFPIEMKKNDIKAVYFGDIFKDMSNLKGYRLDAARGYMNLFKAFKE